MLRRCIAVRQNLGGDRRKAELVLVPQRERFGLCGAVPGLLFVSADVNAVNKSNFLVPSQDDLIEDISRINIYSLASAQEASLKTCPGLLQCLFAKPCLTDMRLKCTLSAI